MENLLRIEYLLLFAFILIVIVIVVFNIWEKAREEKGIKTGLSFVLPNRKLVNNWGEALDLNVGDDVSLWVKPRSSIILVYHPNSVGGKGFLGRIKNGKLASKYPAKRFKIRGTVKSIRGKRVLLEPVLDIVDKVERKKLAVQRKVEMLGKRIRQKVKIYVSYQVPEGFNKRKKVSISFARELKHIDDVKKEPSKWKSLLENFWIVDKNGKKIGGKNLTDLESTIRLIRANMTGYRIKLVEPSIRKIWENMEDWEEGDEIVEIWEGTWKCELIN